MFSCEHDMILFYGRLPIGIANISLPKQSFMLDMILSESISLFQMADQYPFFDNEGSEDERADKEEEENSLAARNTWFGIANSTGRNSS